MNLMRWGLRSSRRRQALWWSGRTSNWRISGDQKSSVRGSGLRRLRAPDLSLSTSMGTVAQDWKLSRMWTGFLSSGLVFSVLISLAVGSQEENTSP